MRWTNFPRLAILVVFSLFSGATLGQCAPNQAPPRAEHPIPSDSNGVKASQATPKDSTTPASQATPSNSEVEANIIAREANEIARLDLAEQVRVATSTQWLEWIGWIGLAITALGVFLVWRTLAATKAAAQYAKLAAEAAKDAVAEAKRTTGAAEKAATQSELAARIQLRAYVSMGPRLLGGLYPGGVVRVQFFPKNHGLTPAYGLTHKFGMRILPNPLPNDFEYPPTTGAVTGDTAIYPDSEERVWFDMLAPSQAEIDEIKKGKMSLHCWGETQFRDIFETRRHVQFRISVSGQDVIASQEMYRGGVRENLPIWSWSYEKGHNNSD